ncbi:hypothetical protein LSTR_LSTR008719 [Laodelphax striatellus]|uniref:ATP synthase subunit f, mitochondrial n=1 Tax=Laodelphax striatellus TaxID=195883 RepID=A0A482XP41_LAOST|nr:hypothetical protein LSTR_LSTR008719 [Laodelphax striatellus]
MDKLGLYPAGYDSKIHGPYDPSRFYGKPDTPFGQVKLGEMGQWLARRNKSPVAMAQAVGRAYWRWSFKYYYARKSGPAPYIQLATAFMIFSYALNYGKIKNHYYQKYH